MITDPVSGKPLGDIVIELRQKIENLHRILGRKRETIKKLRNQAKWKAAYIELFDAGQATRREHHLPVMTAEQRLAHFESIDVA